MDLKTLKNKIENKEHIDDVLILVSGKEESSNFLCNQYISEILSEVGYYDEVTSVDQIIQLKSNKIFEEDKFIICYVQEFDYNSDKLLKYNNIIIKCEKVNQLSESIYKDNIIVFPKLEHWHLEDYICSKCSGLSFSEASDLASKCSYNIYKISNEVDKLSLFKEEQQSSLLKDLIESDFSLDDNNYDIFSLVNPIIQHDFSNLKFVWEKLDTFDSDPMYLLSVLISQYKTIIDVLLHPNSSSELCGISPKRFNAIKFYYKNYTKNQLINVFTFLTEVDMRLKNGDLSDLNLADFIIINTISKGVFNYENSNLF